MRLFMLLRLKIKGFIVFVLSVIFGYSVNFADNFLNNVC